jgi:hypothetical protein
VEDKKTNDRRKELSLEESASVVVVLFMSKERMASIVEETINLIYTLFLVKGFVKQLESLNLMLIDIGVPVLAGPIWAHVKPYTVENEAMKMERVGDDAVSPEDPKTKIFIPII